ncbi:MAG TPA: hypothetical protein VJ300_00435 [Thermoplasmata archaeon]|nr:hypothetical protein [Thermoplasmata archaeon]
MVRPLESDASIFLCDECGLGYADRGTADRCEAFCSSHGACSLEITAHAVYVPK